MSDLDQSKSSPTRPKSRRGGLGRGLESLISTAPRLPDFAQPTEDSESSGLHHASINQIRPNPWQPRLHVQQQQLDELAASIRTHGLMQPLVVTEPDDQGMYTLIAGERRWRASNIAGLSTVPVVVMSATPQEMLEMAIVENVVRADLSPLEEAHAYRRLIDDFNLTQGEVAERVGKSRVTITNTLRLLNAPEQVQQSIVDGEITEGHARALLGLNSLVDQLSLLEQIRSRSLSVRQTEAQVRTWAKPKSLKAADPVRFDAEHIRIESRLRDALGTRVTLTRSANNNNGRIIIEFSSDEHLKSIVDRLTEEEFW